MTCFCFVGNWIGFVHFCVHRNEPKRHLRGGSMPPLKNLLPQKGALPLLKPRNAKFYKISRFKQDIKFYKAPRFGDSKGGYPFVPFCGRESEGNPIGRVPLGGSLVHFCPYRNERNNSTLSQNLIRSTTHKNKNKL